MMVVGGLLWGLHRGKRAVLTKWLRGWYMVMLRGGVDSQC
jgi:hypothetical protein